MSSIKVAVRVRPLNQREVQLGSKFIIDMDGCKTSITNAKVPETATEGDTGRETMRLKEFTFDHSFWTVNRNESKYASQEQVFNALGLDVVKNAYVGYNNCVFAYGQTGSGKTYTMMGEMDDPGLIPRICRELYDRMVDENTSYRTEVSYLEIYNEKVRDLLKHSNTSNVTHNLRVREHPKDGPYVQDLSKHKVKKYEDIEEVMRRGNHNRTTASTNMNDVSSRSHAIFTILFTQANFSQDLPREVHSKIHLVDLAGSERADATGSTGIRLKEGASINKSLVTLGNVISVLAEMSEKGGKGKFFIPYRDSVLTWLLKDSLGGNAKTVMITTISPADVNYAETLSALRYANRAKNIINKPTINEDANVKLIRELRMEIARLKALLGGDIDNITTPKVQERIHESEARVKVLTEEWAGKWKESANILQQEKNLALRKEGLGVVLDSALPHLIGIDDDILSTGIMLYHLKEGKTSVGTTDARESPDIALAGLDVNDKHCVIENGNSTVTLFPLEDSLCTVNGNVVTSPTKLTQGAVILLGRTNMFRFNNPAEAAKLKKEFKRNSLSLSKTSILSQSMSDIYKSSDNVSYLGMGFDIERLKREEEEKLEEKRRQIEEMEEKNKQAEEEHQSKQLSLETDLISKQQELEKMQISMYEMKSELEKVHGKTTGSEDSSPTEINTSQFGSIERTMKIVENCDMEEAIKQTFLKEFSRLIERERQHIENAQMEKENILKEIETLKTNFDSQKRQNESSIRKLETMAKEKETMIQCLEEELQKKKLSLKEKKEKETEQIDDEVKDLRKLEQKIQEMKKKPVEDIHKEDDEMRQRIAEIQRREIEVEARLEKTDKEKNRRWKKLVEEIAVENQKLEDAWTDLKDHEAHHLKIMQNNDFKNSSEKVEFEKEQEELEFLKSFLCDEEQELERREKEVIEVTEREMNDWQEEKEIELNKLAEEKEMVFRNSKLFNERIKDMDRQLSCRTKSLDSKKKNLKSHDNVLLELDTQMKSQILRLMEEQKSAKSELESINDLLNLHERELQKNVSNLNRRIEDTDRSCDRELLTLHEERFRLEQELYKITKPSSVSTGTLCMNGDDSSTMDDSDLINSKEELNNKMKEVEVVQRELENMRLELEEREHRFNDERDSELDRIDYERLKLQEMEHKDRVNALVEQEVKKRLFEEKVQREKIRRMEREKEKRERELEINKIKQDHEREIRQLKAKYELQMGDPEKVLQRSRSNPYMSTMAPDGYTATDQVRRKMSSSGSFNKPAPRLSVCIPSFRLLGHGIDSHYEYEVKITVNEDSWTVFRRYSKFRELHHDLKNTVKEIRALSFPPKKFFSKSEKVVAERRNLLEFYLINALKMCTRSTDCPLNPSINPTLSKKILCDFAPFFRKGLFETSKYGTS